MQLPIFEQESFFWFLFILALLTTCSSLRAEKAPQCCAVDDSNTDLWCVSVCMNLDLNSNEKLCQCHRCLALKSNCLSVVYVLYLIWFLWIFPTLVVLSELSLRDMLRSESFQYVSLLEEIYHMWHRDQENVSFTTSFWSSNQSIAAFTGVSESSQAQKTVGWESAELILLRSCSNTTSSIRWEPFLLSCSFWLLFLFLKFSDFLQGLD